MLSKLLVCSTCPPVHSLQKTAEDAEFRAGSVQREAEAWRTAEATHKVGGQEGAAAEAAVAVMPVSMQGLAYFQCSHISCISSHVDMVTCCACRWWQAAVAT
jgi:hypothetical protein